MKITYEIYAQPKTNHDHNDSEIIYRCILKALNQLTTRDQKVIQLYFGINESKDHTIEEIGQYFFITKERAAQLVGKAISRIREIFKNSIELNEFRFLLQDIGIESDADFSFNTIISDFIERQNIDENENEEESIETDEYKTPDFETELDNISNQYKFDYEAYIGVDALLKLSNR